MPHHPTRNIRYLQPDLQLPVSMMDDGWFSLLLLSHVTSTAARALSLSMLWTLTPDLLAANVSRGQPFIPLKHAMQCILSCG